MAELALAKWVATTNLSKAYMDDKGKPHVTAIVSDSLTDLENDQMTQKALQGMVDQFKKGVDLIDNHRSTFGFGRTVDANLIMDKDKNGSPYWKVMVDIELDDSFPEARSLYKEVSEGNCKKQLSIGGSVPHTEKDAIGVAFDKSGKMVRQINKVALDHVACTRKEMAANPRTGFIGAIMKSLQDLNAFDGLQPTSLEKDNSVSDNQKVEGQETEGLTKDVSTGIQFLDQIGKLIKNGGNSMAKLMKDIAEDPNTQQDSFPLDSFLAEDDGAMLEDNVGAEGDAGMAGGDDAMMQAATDANAGGDVIDPAAEVNAGTVAPVDAGAGESGELFGDAGAAPVADDMDKGMEELAGADAAVSAGGMGDEMGMDDGMGGDMGMGDDLDMNDGGEWSDEELMAAKAVLKARRQKMLAKQQKSVNVAGMLSEIALLMQHTPLAKGLNPKKADRVGMTLTKALSDVRFVLAGQVLKEKFVPDSVRGMAKLIKEQGVFAPGGDFMDANDDKASGSTDIASTNVTGADKQPEYAKSAEGPEGGASEAKNVMSNAISDTAKLPQMGEDDEFGKSKKETLNLVKSLATELAKGFDTKMKQLQGVIEAQQKTIEALTKAPGIAKSRSNGRLEVEKSTKEGVFNGLFNVAATKATSKM